MGNDELFATVNEMDALISGDYQLDMIDQEGKLLFCTRLTREE